MLNELGPCSWSEGSCNLWMSKSWANAGADWLIALADFLIGRDWWFWGTMPECRVTFYWPATCLTVFVPRYKNRRRPTGSGLSSGRRKPAPGRTGTLVGNSYQGNGNDAADSWDGASWSRRPSVSFPIPSMWRPPYRSFQLEGSGDEAVQSRPGQRCLPAAPTANSGASCEITFTTNQLAVLGACLLPVVQ